MNRAEIAHQRLHNLRITAPPLAALEEVVRWLGAVQSQDFPAARWGIGHRTLDLHDREVDQAFQTGRLVRTHVLRPTWHFVLPEDLRWMLELTGPRVHAVNAHYSRQFGVHDVLADGQRTIVRALESGEHLTRKDVQAALRTAGIEASGPGLAYVLMYAELNGVICSGPMRGKQHTYALVEARVPAAAKLTRDEALAELTRRFFTSHGPATVNDYHWWSSLTVADIKRGLDMLGSELSSETVDGATYWFAASAQPATAQSPSLHLLQGYDEYFVGYSGESKAVLDLANRARSEGQASGALMHVIVLDSQVVGRWQRSLTQADLGIQVQLYAALDEPAHHALRSAVDAYGQFMQLPARLVEPA